MPKHMPDDQRGHLRTRALASLARISDAEEAAVQRGIAEDPDAAELGPVFFARARGPQRLPVKEKISLRLDQDILRHYRATGRGWQSRLNADLRRLVEAG